MLSEKEKEFVDYWKSVRVRESSFARKLLSGLPVAAVFGLPIILFVVVIYLFFPDWYYKISGTSAGTFMTMVFAVVVIILFFSFFRKQFKWEMNEQLYNELLKKNQKAKGKNE